MEEKVCTKCGVSKPITEFYRDKQKATGYRPDCKKCNTEQCVARAKQNRERVNFNNLKHTTGVDRKLYESLLDEQKGVCAICGKPNPSPDRKLSVDHCHDTLYIRGLLCTKCNFGLGYFDDDEELMKKAIIYLKDNLSKRKIKFKGKKKPRRI